MASVAEGSLAPGGLLLQWLHGTYTRMSPKPSQPTVAEPGYFLNGLRRLGLQEKCLDQYGVHQPKLQLNCVTGKDNVNSEDCGSLKETSMLRRSI